MLQLSGALLENLDVRKLLGAISASIGEVIPHDCATLGLYDRAEGCLWVQFLGTHENEIERGDVRVPLEGSPAGEAFRTREPVLLQRMQDSRFVTETVRHLSSLGMQSGLLGAADQSRRGVGTITVASRHRGCLSRT